VPYILQVDAGKSSTHLEQSRQAEVARVRGGIALCSSSVAAIGTVCRPQIFMFPMHAVFTLSVSHGLTSRVGNLPLAYAITMCLKKMSFYLSRNLLELLTNRLS
jgi:hypothetical protein